MIVTRTLLWVIGFLGSLYALIGLFNALPDVGFGLAVTAATVVGWGLCDWLEDK